MIIIETPHHIIFRSYSDLPYMTCSGPCKKVLWISELNKSDKCPQCKGALTIATRSDYHILALEHRNLTLKDFEKYAAEIKPFERKLVIHALNLNAMIESISNVKPQYEELARRSWL